MRPIEFRGYDQYLERWLYGSLLIEECKGEVVCMIRQQGHPHDDQVDPATVGQYIGREDPTGKKIFGGDITRRDDIVGVVFYNKNASEFTRKDKNGYYHTLWPSDVVVGNVTDNPELLTA